MDNYGLDDMKMILAPSALIICILWDTAVDVAKDYLNVQIPSRLPTNLFVLSALTIQILTYVDVEKVNVFSAKDMHVSVDNQLRMDAARLTMCVFVGCLLPGMAEAGSVGGWSNVAALLLTLSFHIATEIYALHNGNDSPAQSEAGPSWFISSGVILLVGASSLLLLLGVVMLYGKFVRDQRPGIEESISEDVINQGEKWKTLGSEMMKSWVAARAWKAKYFVMTSAFSPGAGVIVTICVAVMAAKLGCSSSLLLSRNNNRRGKLTFYLQCSFILVGWILMLCRWFKAAVCCAYITNRYMFTETVTAIFMPAAVVVSPLSPTLAYILFHPEKFPMGNYKSSDIIFTLLCCLPLLPLLLLISSIQEFKLRNIIICLLCLVPLLPLCALILPVSLLWSFCFICWRFSHLVLGGHFLQRLFKLNKEADSEIEKYISKLHGMNISIAEHYNLINYWMVNKKSFDRLKVRFDEANKKAQNCTGLPLIIAKHKASQGFSLNDITQGLLLRQRRMTTMSGIFGAMAGIEMGKDLKDVLAAYRGTRDVVKFVDFPDNIVIDPLNIFGTLNFRGFKDSIDCEESVRSVERKLEQGLGTSPGAKEELTIEQGWRVERWCGYLSSTLSDTVLNRLKVCRSHNELGEMLCTLLCQIIVSGLIEAQHLLLKYSKQWAENCDERKIEAAIEVAGTVSGLLEKLAQAGKDISTEEMSVKEKDGNIRSSAEIEKDPSESGAKVSEGGEIEVTSLE